MPPRRAPLRRTALARLPIPRRRTSRPGFDQRTRALIRDRDAVCQGCGATPAQARERGLRLEAHHRLPTGRGGHDGPDNGVLLCGLGNSAGCHRRVDHERGWAYARGLVLRTGVTPGQFPVTDWAGRDWLLDPHGQRHQL